ncbi:MAG TPA: AAA domain-containing protein, partial [Balneolaceae bacterium]|nr:AAA domain-containing protein [Balneolaceae bacterium]
MKDRPIKKLIKKAIGAVEDEIEAVREQPSRDVLFDGQRREHHPPDTFYYEFDSKNKSIRFADVIRGELQGGDDEFELYPVEVDDEKVVLEFPHNFGEKISKVRLEWENDFVLKRLKWELEGLHEARSRSVRKRVAKLFDPDAEKHHHPDENTRVVDDSRRNEAQHEALIKSNQNDVLFVWGPPGTGKTATLGFMMANYLVKGKRVLFASNTNRAVDVGLLSVLQALTAVEKEHLEDEITRFGEIALENERLEQRLFDRLLEQREQEQKQKATELSNTLEKYQKLQREIDTLMEHGETVPPELDREINRLGKKLDKHGGEEAVKDKIDDIMLINERTELMRCPLVGTTLAKVCTSDLFSGQEFDAVVVDEASMANLPYLMVLAAKTKQHIVMVGDPMQLPPIALTNNPSSRRFLEKDIFTHVSEAEKTEDLFAWHDANRPLTTFFDTQYRLNRDLAKVLSSVFYGGRLKTVNTAMDGQDAATSTSQATVNVINTAKYGAQLHQKDEGRGFSPVNSVHLQLIVRIVKKLVLKNNVLMNQIGVMVPFRNTVYDVRRELYSEGYEAVEVGTIHTFQGREKEVIIFDTVMSGEEQRGRRRHYSVRPFDEEKNGLAVPRLLNVAFSRSKERLVILADMNHIHRIYS